MFIEIPGYTKYFLYDDGRLYSARSNKFLSIFLNTAGYPCYKLQKEGKQKNLLVHRLLAFLFKNLPSLDSDLEVDHQDRDRTNFRLQNLNVLTKSQHISKTLNERGHAKRMNTCPVCFSSIDNRASFCKKHMPKAHPEITVEQIEFWVRNYSWSRASRELGLSDNGLRRRYKSLSGKDPKSIKHM